MLGQKIDPRSRITLQNEPESIVLQDPGSRFLKVMSGLLLFGGLVFIVAVGMAGGSAGSLFLLGSFASIYLSVAGYIWFLVSRHSKVVFDLAAGNVSTSWRILGLGRWHLEREVALSEVVAIDVIEHDGETTMWGVRLSVTTGKPADVVSAGSWHRRDVLEQLANAIAQRLNLPPPRLVAAR